MIKFAGMEKGCKHPLHQRNHNCEDIKLKHTVVSRLPTENSPRMIVIENFRNENENEKQISSNNL